MPTALLFTAMVSLVNAAAMTLLAIELPLPQGDTPSRVWHSFVEDLGGEYLAFLISFAVIAAFSLTKMRAEPSL